MTHLSDRPINSEVVFLIEGNHTAGNTVSVYKDGVVTTQHPTLTSAGAQGPSTLRFTPTATGLYTFVMSDGSIAGSADVVSRTSQSMLKNLEDEALGSWVWDRVNGTLQMLRQDGSVLANFAVVDTQTEGSRERLQ